MIPDFSKDDLTKWIASGREQEAIEAILKVAKYQDRDLQSQIFLTSNRYRKLRKSISLGSISRENASITSSEINQSLLDIIDQIRVEEITEKEVKKQLAREKRKKSLWPLVLSAAGLLVMVIAIMLIQGRLGTPQISTPTPEPPKHYLQQWAGDWKQTVEIDEEQQIGGKLTFTVDQNEIEGMAYPTYANGSSTQNRLFNIVFSENGRKLKGKWKYEEVLNGPEGTFEFTLDQGQQSFSGTYHSAEAPQAIFQWTGEKLE